MRHSVSGKFLKIKALVGMGNLIDLLYSLTIPVATTVAFHLFLKASGPIVMLTALVCLAEFVFFLRAILSGIARQISGWALFASYLAGGFVVYLLIIMIPFPVYKAWLSSLGKQSAGGTISFLFVLGVALFSSAIAGSVHVRGKIEPLLYIVTVLTLMVTILYQNLFLAIADVLLIALCIAYILIRTKRTRARTFSFAGLSLLAMIGFSGAFAGLIRFDKGSFVNMTISRELKRFVVDSFGGSQFVTSLAGYGFSFDMENPGAKPMLSPQPVFSIRADRGKILYIRSNVFDDYSLGAWHNPDDLSEGEIYHAVSPDSGAVSAEGKIDITLLLDYYPMIPHTLSALSIVLPDLNGAGSVYGSIDRGLIPELPLIRDNHVVIYPGAIRDPRLRKKLSILDTNFGSIESEANPVSQADADYITSCLSVPGDLGKMLADISHEAALGRAGERSIFQDWNKLRNIYFYLSDHYKFSLNTVKSDNNPDLVGDFLLSSKKGYSVHFASALVMLARMNRIPARLVTGFLAFFPDDSDALVVTGYNAHAWAEVMLDGIGWSRVEACPFLDPRFLNSGNFYERFNADNDPETEKQLAAIMGNIKKPAEKKKQQTDMRPVFVAIGIVLSGGILVFFIPILVRYIKAHRVPLSGNARRVYFSGLRLVMRYAEKGVPKPASTGWNAWKASMERRYPSKKLTLASIVGILEKSFYSRVPPSDDDVRSLETAIKELGKER